jgi:hypothetical protein
VCGLAHLALTRGFGFAEGEEAAGAGVRGVELLLPPLRRTTGRRVLPLRYSWTLGPSFLARTELFRLAPSLTRPAKDSGPSRVIILEPQRPRAEPGSARSTRLARVFLQGSAHPA